MLEVGQPIECLACNMGLPIPMGRRPHIEVGPSLFHSSFGTNDSTM